MNQVRNVSKLLETLAKYIPLNSDQLKRQCTTASKTNGSGKKLSNTPHPPRDPPDDYQPKTFEHKAFTVPECLPPAIFRPFQSSNETLGPDAAKTNDYKNPEYFAYHRYSFAQLQAVSLKLRQERQESGGMHVIYEYSGSDSGSGSDTDSNNDLFNHQKDQKDQITPSDNKSCPQKPPCSGK